MSAVAALVLAAAVPAAGVAGRWQGTVTIADREVPVAVDPDAVLGLRVAFVDPAGRIGEIASLDV